MGITSPFKEVGIKIGSLLDHKKPNAKKRGYAKQRGRKKVTPY